MNRLQLLAVMILLASMSSCRPPADERHMSLAVPANGQFLADYQKPWFAPLE